MRKISLLCIAWLVACSADNTIADPTNQTQQLQDRVEPFCTEICSWLPNCTVEETCSCSGDVCTCVGPADPVDCPAECQEFFDSYRGGGETCAQVGMNLMDCFETQSCETVMQGIGDPCDHISEAHPECGTDSVDPTTDNPLPGPSGSGGSGIAGSSAAGGSFGAGSVSCMGGFGIGSAGTGAGGGPTTTCNQGLLECSDGHDYQVICLAGSSGVSSCTCFVDNLAQGNFQFPQQCPSTNDVNANCSWNLAWFGP